MTAALRAFFGYLFLIFVVRIVGRRPGKQLTPFEFVLIFFIGGLALTAMVGDDASFTNALCQIVAIALGHFLVAWLRNRSSRLARLFDGTPLILLEEGQWRIRTLRQKGVESDDVMSSARDSGLKSFDQIDHAVLERNGEISVIGIKPHAKAG